MFYLCKIFFSIVHLISTLSGVLALYACVLLLFISQWICNKSHKNANFLLQQLVLCVCFFLPQVLLPCDLLMCACILLKSTYASKFISLFKNKILIVMAKNKLKLTKSRTYINIYTFNVKVQIMIFPSLSHRFAMTYFIVVRATKISFIMWHSDLTTCMICSVLESEREREQKKVLDEKNAWTLIIKRGFDS